MTLDELKSLDIVATVAELQRLREEVALLRPVERAARRYITVASPLPRNPELEVLLSALGDAASLQDLVRRRDL